MRAKETTLLGNLAKIRTGKLDANASSDNGKYPFFTCAKNPLRINQYTYDCECILIAGNGDLNAKYYKGKFDAYQRTYIIEPTSNLINCKFLFYFLDTYLEELRRLSIGGVIKYIKLQNLTEAKIPLPPIDEQRRIAKILDTVSQLYLKSETRLKSLIKLTDSDFHELISSLNSSTNTSRYSLGELCEVNSGITKGRKLKEDKKITIREIPYMAVLNVQDKQLNLDQVKTIAVTEEEIEKFRLSLDDLLLTEGGDPDKLGRGTVWKGEIKECIHQNHIFRVRAKSKNLNMEYISWLISSEYGKKYFLRCAKQTTGIATINKTQLKEFPVLLPSDNQLQRFQKLMTNVNTTQKNMNKANQLFKNLVESMSASHLKSKEK